MTARQHQKDLVSQASAALDIALSRNMGLERVTPVMTLAEVAEAVRRARGRYASFPDVRAALDEAVAAGLATKCAYGWMARFEKGAR